MKIIKSNEYQNIDVPFEAKKIFSSSSIEVITINLKENEGIDLHTMPMKVLFYVMEGNAFLLTEEKETEVKKNDCIYFENPNEKRGWQCKENQTIKLLVIKYQ